jgi:CspA family cold shock protein
MNGKVKFFNSKRGWGFIAPDDGSENIFVHYKGIKNGMKENGKVFLEEDQKVTFELSKNEKGRIAIDVSILDEVSIGR